MTFLMLKQSLTFTLPLGNAYTKSTMRDPNSNMQFEVYLAMAVVEHKMPAFCSGGTFMEYDKYALVQKEITEGLTKDLGKSLESKYEGI
jgi:hypothetical protein